MNSQYEYHLKQLSEIRIIEKHNNYFVFSHIIVLG
jgi:hypothetical protein